MTKRLKLSASLFSILILTTVPVRAIAQDDAPGPAERDAGAERPKFYQFKRAINPLHWLSSATKPVFRLVESGQLGELGGPASPSDPKMSGVKVSLGTMGGGSGFGPKVTPYHRNLLGRGIEVETDLLYTYKRYEEYRFNLGVPLLREDGEDPVDRLKVNITGAYESRASDYFFGLGNDSSLTNSARFRSVTREVGAGVSSDLSATSQAALQLNYRSIGITNPRKLPSAQDVFGADDIPGLRSGADLLTTKLVFEHDDNRNTETFPTTGGLQRLEVSLNEGVGGSSDFSYWKYTFRFQHLFALSEDQRQGVAFRGSMETNQERNGSEIPFFELATIGGSRTLRGFQSLRFRDKSALSLTAEYRYRIWKAFDWALFVEEAQVAPEPGDFGMGRFHTGYGVRLMMRPTEKRPVIMDIAHSREGWRFHFHLNSSF